MKNRNSTDDLNCPECFGTSLMIKEFGSAQDADTISCIECNYQAPRFKFMFGNMLTAINNKIKNALVHNSFDQGEISELRSTMLEHLYATTGNYSMLIATLRIAGVKFTLVGRDIIIGDTIMTFSAEGKFEGYLDSEKKFVPPK
jgi:hypothetical protein